MPFSFDVSLGKLNSNVNISKNGIRVSNSPRPLAEFQQSSHYELQADYCGSSLGGYLTQMDFDMVVEAINSEFEELRSLRESTVCLTRSTICGCLLFVVPGILVYPFASSARSKERETFRRAKDRARAVIREKNTQIGDGRVFIEMYTFKIFADDPCERIGIKVVYNPDAPMRMNAGLLNMPMGQQYYSQAPPTNMYQPTNQYQPYNKDFVPCNNQNVNVFGNCPPPSYTPVLSNVHFNN